MKVKIGSVRRLGQARHHIQFSRTGHSALVEMRLVLVHHQPWCAPLTRKGDVLDGQFFVVGQALGQAGEFHLIRSQIGPVSPAFIRFRRRLNRPDGRTQFRCTQSPSRDSHTAKLQRHFGFVWNWLRDGVS